MAIVVRVEKQKLQARFAEPIARGMQVDQHNQPDDHTYDQHKGMQPRPFCRLINRICTFEFSHG